jgi:hypothetical protein
MLAEVLRAQKAQIRRMLERFDAGRGSAARARQADSLISGGSTVPNSASSSTEHKLIALGSYPLKAVTPENRIAPEHLFITSRIRTIQLFECVANFLFAM